MKFSSVFNLIAVVIVVYACKDGLWRRGRKETKTEDQLTSETGQPGGNLVSMSGTVHTVQAEEITEERVDENNGDLQEEKDKQKLIEKETTKMPEPKILVLGVRGLRWSYIWKITNDMKYVFSSIQTLIEHGLHATHGIVPAFPTTPVPNYHAMVTGRPPGEHGIVADEFYDKEENLYFGVDPYTYSYTKESTEKSAVSVDLGKKVFGGEPIWETMKGEVACLYWPGCEFGDFEEGHSVPFDHENPYEKKWEDMIVHVKKWLDDESIKLVLVDYRDVIDTATWSGSDEQSTYNHLHYLDDAIKKLVEALGQPFQDHKYKTKHAESPMDAFVYLLEKLNLNLIIVGSSGLEQLKEAKAQLSNEVIDTELLDTEIDVWTMVPSMWLVQPKSVAGEDGVNDEDVDKVYKYFVGLKEGGEKIDVYKAPDVPDNWHYKGNKRIPSLIVTATPRYRLSSSKWVQMKQYSDGYAYSITETSVAPAFIAHGPAFKKQQTIERGKMSTKHVHSLLFTLLKKDPPAATVTEDSKRFQTYMAEFLNE